MTEEIVTSENTATGERLFDTIASSNVWIAILTAPRVTSAYFDPAFERLGGKSIILRLARRLEELAEICSGFYVVASRNATTANRFRRELRDTRFELLECEGVAQLDLLMEVCRRSEEKTTLLLYPELAVFPDVEAVSAMLDEHVRNRAHASVGVRVPTGLLPVIMEASVIRELAAVELPAECGNDVLGLLEIANRLFPDDYNFHIHQYDYAGKRGISIASLPASLVIQDSPRRAAAAKVAFHNDRQEMRSFVEAQMFKRELIQNDCVSQAPRKRPIFSSRPAPILFTSYVGGLSGAEASWAALISRLDRDTFTPLVLLPTPSALSDRLEAVGTEVQFADWDFTKISPAALQYFTGLLKERDISLVNVNGHAGLPILVAAHALGIPIVTHIRIYDSVRMQDCLKFSDTIVTVSKAVMEDVRRCDIDPDRVVTVYNGVDLSEFAPGRVSRQESRQKLCIPQDAEVIAVVARVHPDKRYDLFLQALAAIRSRRPSVLAFCVGEAYPEQQGHLQYLQRRVKQLDLSSIVHWAGFTNDMQSVYAAADVLAACNPSEPLARCTIEACAMGLPAIVPASGGSLEIVRHQHNGLLFEPDNVESLAATLTAYLEAPDLRARLSRGALATAQEFSLDSHVAQMTSIFEKLVNGATAHCALAV